VLRKQLLQFTHLLAQSDVLAHREAHRRDFIGEGLGARLCRQRRVGLRERKAGDDR
jgi:hypothetical protein